MTTPSELESVLYRLARADNRTRFGEEHGLELDDDRVLVMVELDDDTDIPDGYDLTVTSEYGTQVEAYATIDDLLPLVGEPGVRLVRTPAPAEPQG